MKKMRRTVFAGILLVVLLFTGFSFNSPASIAQNRDTVKYYTTVQVDAGDSLWSIAGEYMTPEYEDMDDYIEEIKSINGLRGNLIQQGGYLSIPYYAAKGE
ncbi:MAG: LysM peptidoglycan-binding domain-containing protein [Blautia sp.]